MAVIGSLRRVHTTRRRFEKHPQSTRFSQIGATHRKKVFEKSVPTAPDVTVSLRLFPAAHSPTPPRLCPIEWESSKDQGTFGFFPTRYSSRYKELNIIAGETNPIRIHRFHQKCAQHRCIGHLQINGMSVGYTTMGKGNRHGAFGNVLMHSSPTIHAAQTPTQ